MDEQSIFLEALQKETPEERTAFLAEACGGDEGVRHEIEMLLKAHNKVGGFLQGAPAGIEKTLDQPITEKPGTQIGPYKLLQQIGEGGMGVVYMAEQKQPMKRRVALKIIKPGMDTRQVIARFEAERQALAMMDHPNIAKVLDAGQTESGRPYFVMELVNGISVTKYCDQQHLTPKERLNLFVHICQAVQHAHQKGIIHRDLKPSNVLVALYDGKAVPKVIDFGVAKATNQSLTDKTMFTQLGQIVGTLEYMSPEQAQRNQLDVDTRSDIYSLGVILYELLSGETPFDSKKLRSAALEEMLRIIREDEPSKPSTKVSSSESLPSIAANRRIDPQKLGATIRGELDWIVMKALEKDRARRYETANGLAADLRRYLDDEPVLACPPSTAYRFRKFARRNKATIASAVVIGAALLLGMIGTTWQAIRATQAERQAQTNLTQANEQRDIASQQRDRAELAAQEAEKARHQESVQRKLASQQQVRAEENLERAHQAVRDYLTIVSDSEELAIPALQTLRSKLLQSALGYYEQFLTQKTDDPHLKLEMAVTYLRVGQVYYNIDRLDDAIAALASGLDILDQLRRDHPDVAHCPTSVSGFWRGVQSVRRDAKAPVDSQVAMATLRRAINLWEEFVDECPEEAGFRADLAIFRMHNVDLISSYAWFGTTQGSLHQGAVKTVKQDAERALELLNQLVIEHPESQHYRADLALVGEYVARLARESKDWERAATLSERSLTLWTSLNEEFPQQVRYRLSFARSLLLTADRHRYAGHVAEAEAKYRHSIKLVQGLTSEFPNVQSYAEALSDSLCSFAMLLHQQGKKEEAAKQLQAANEIWDFQIAKSSNLAAMSVSFEHLGNALSTTGHKAEAVHVYQKYVEGLAHAIEAQPTVPEHQWRRSIALRELGFILSQLNRQREAIESFEEAHVTVAALNAAYPDEQKYKQEMKDHSAMLRRRVGNVHAAKNDFDLAISDFNEAIRINPEYWPAYINRGWAYWYTQQFELALKDANHILEKRPWDANYLLGHIHLAQGDHETAISDFQRAIESKPGSNWGYNMKGWAQLRGGRIKDASATINRAVELAIGEDDRLGAFWCFFSRASLHLAQGNRDEAMADFRATLEAFDESLGLDPALQVEEALTIAITNWHLGNHQQAREHYANAVELIERWPIDRNQYHLWYHDEAKGLLETSSKAEETSEKDK